MYQQRAHLKSLLNKLEKQFECRILFHSLKEYNENLVLKDKQTHIPACFNDEIFGYFSIEHNKLSDKSLKMLEALIQETVLIFVQKVRQSSSVQDLFDEYHSDQNKAHIPDSNVLNIFTQKAQKLNNNSSLVFVSADTKQEILHEALKIHASGNQSLFMHIESVMKEKGSFEDWSHFLWTTLFVPFWSDLKDWQKTQIKQFIFSSQTSPALKIIIGLKGENEEWKVS